jgi:hypothetical protein
LTRGVIWYIILTNLTTLKPNQNRKQSGGNDSRTAVQNSLRATVVNAVFPSRSGNSRVKVTLSNRAVYHFYMTPEGAEHIPDGHKNKQVSLDDKELGWAHKTWSKNNPSVQRVDLPVGDMFKKAEKLAIEKFNASKKIVRPKHTFIPKSGVTMGTAFGETLAKIKENCTE